MRTASNPARSTVVDEGAARELELYITNDADLYRQQWTPIIRNLMLKRQKGVYDSAKAVTLFMYLVDNGAKKYLREFSTGERIDTVFTRPTRLAVAASLRDSFETEAELGNYDNMVGRRRNPSNRRAVKFFSDHAGSVVGQKMQGALALARAEEAAEERGWRVEWEGDVDADWSWMDEDERAKEHEVLVAVLYDAKGKVLASLGGIFDPDKAYGRVIEAELALEALTNGS